jgi:Protein of unknown function (DUF732)
MSMLIKIGVAFAVAVIGLAAPAHADDAQDQTFAQLLDSRGLLFNFRLERMQGLRACEDISDGYTTGLEAADDLMSFGSYSFDVASSIISAAMVAYCPWNLGR